MRKKKLLITAILCVALAGCTAPEAPPETAAPMTASDTSVTSVSSSTTSAATTSASSGPVTSTTVPTSHETNATTETPVSSTAVTSVEETTVSSTAVTSVKETTVSSTAVTSTEAATSVKSTSATTETELSASETTASSEPEITAENDVDDDFTETMYDYSFAGSKSALGRVNAADHISVTDYGVVPDTATDYSDNIIRAVYDAAAKGKYLYFPEGTYHVKNIKIRDTANVRICGAGDLSVGVLQLRIDNCAGASVYGCTFRNNNNGNINIVGQAEGLKIYYCDFLNSDCSVVVMPGYITNGFICNNFIDGQDWEWSEPISLYNAPDDDKPNRNVIISGNDIRNHTQGAGGVFITFPSRDIYVLSNYFYRCGAAIGSGTRLQTENDDRGPRDVVCRDNVIDSPTWHGFALLYAEGWTIENNTILNITDGFAMYLDKCRGNTVINNSTGGSRIYEVDCSGNVIYGNG